MKSLFQTVNPVIGINFLFMTLNHWFIKGKYRITLPQLVQYLCMNPSRMYGLYPQKGTLLPGSDADLILLNPEKERILTHADMHSAVDYTCYEGMAVKGEIELVMQRGHVIVKENQFLGKKWRRKISETA